MSACPTDSYHVTDKGVVIHDDESCIGCQYCTWACPYGVPVYQADRGIVTKCDMCHNRLEAGQDPACVQACPAEAIKIEKVTVGEVLATYMEVGQGPAMPDPAITIPSTKITLPVGMNIADFKKVDQALVHPEQPHSPLIAMTIFTQMAVGGFIFAFLFDVLQHLTLSAANPWGKTTVYFSASMLAVTLVSLLASTLHLGRPIYAYRAIKCWRTSWLSREVLALGLFAQMASLYVVFLLLTDGLGWLNSAVWGASPLRWLLGASTCVSGLIGIYASSRIYRVPARPAWNSVKTTWNFYSTALILGPLTVACALALSGFLTQRPAESYRVYLCFSLASCGIVLALKSVLNAYTLKQRAHRAVDELKATAQLYTQWFYRLRGLRNVLAGSTLILLFYWLTVRGAVTSAYDVLFLFGTLAVQVAYSLITRYLFYVTVVPKNIPGNFLIAAQQAAGAPR